MSHQDGNCCKAKIRPIGCLMLEVVDIGWQIHLTSKIVENVYTSGSLPPSRLTKRPLPPCEAEACRHGTTGTMKNFPAKTDASGIEKQE